MPASHFQAGLGDFEPLPRAGAEAAPAMRTRAGDRLAPGPPTPAMRDSRTMGPILPKVAPAEEPIMRYFEYDHLPAYLQEVSQPFKTLADFMMTLPRCAERTAGLRKLLEAKDCAVRAALEAEKV